MSLTEDRIEEKLAELIRGDGLDSGTVKLVSMRFGIGYDRPMACQEIAKRLRRPIKKVKQELETAERRVFNLIKDKV